MPINQLKDFLDREHIRYVTIGHSKAFTAQEVAASAHIPGREMAKTVIVKLDGKLAMVAVPANHKVNLEHLKEATGVRKTELATEEEFSAAFPECELGAMPPFGNLYGLDVFVEDTLAKDEEIAFNAGSHTELIKLAYRDFERLARPKLVSV